jgi:hypothetical protein
MRYFVFLQNIDLEDAAVLTKPPAQIADELYRFDEGVPLRDWFPSPAEFPMNPDFPKSRKLYPLQATTIMGLIVASKELRATFEEVGCDNLEYLPIIILDHRKKVASTDYAIANVLHLIDAMDRERSVFDNNALLPTRVSGIEKLVLLEDRIPPDRHLFRMTNAPQFPIVSETLKKAIEKKKLGGMRFIVPEEFDDALY